ncbi:MAG: hypothetical protein GQ553_00285 [Nitrosomonadaceae bacterium]|nr:hypothetical protein [Nitrosomonadaceae bacterium]
MTFPTFKDKRYYPEEVDVVVGTIDAGNRFSVREVDADVLEISEIAGAVPTGGFDVIFTFKGVMPPWYRRTDLRIIIDGYYDGNAAHEVKIYVWNYDTDAWDAVTADAKDLPDKTVEDNYEFVVPTGPYTDGTIAERDRYEGTGEVKVRVIHNDSGNAAHDIFFNRVTLGFSSHESRAGIAG